MNTTNSADLIFFLNGRKVIEKNPNPGTFLLTYLRETLNLRGTKIGCGEGGCGSCTIMVSRFNGRNSNIRHEARYACMTPICLLHGASVVTIEGMGSTRLNMHELQSYLVKGHGVQCGFCTPGMIMSACALLRSNPKPDELDIENAIKGNLCRCTGYRPIIDSFKAYAKDLQSRLTKESCDKTLIGSACEEEANYISDIELIGNEKSCIFPHDLKHALEEDLVFKSEEIVWHSPINKEKVLALKEFDPSSQIIAGGNLIAYKLKQMPTQEPLTLIALSRINEFNELAINNKGITLAPNVTFSDFESALKKISFSLSGSKPNLIGPLLDMCQAIASIQIKNSATVCGGLAQGIQGSDLNILLLAAECRVTLLSNTHERVINVDVEFLTNKTLLRSNEIISKLFIPFHNKQRFFGFYKLSPRRDLSRAVLNCGFSVEFDGTAECSVKSCFFSYGGPFDRPLVMFHLQSFLNGKSWKVELLSLCLEQIEKDFNDPKNREIVTVIDDHMTFILHSMQGLFIKFFLKMLFKLFHVFPDLPSPAANLISTANWEDLHMSDLHSGTQIYNHNQEHPASSTNDLGKPLSHRWASQSATGEALFIDDQRHYNGELCLSIVMSMRAHANIIKVNYTEAMKAPGVVGYIDHTSVQGSNVVELFEPRELFATTEVHYVGQPIAAVIALSHEQAQQASCLVSVEYEDLPTIISIEDAIRENSFHEIAGGGQLNKGDTESAFVDPNVETLESEINIGAQEHFYMETHCCRVVPLMEDGGELEVFAGTQFASGLHETLSRAVNLPQNKINVHIKRMGGAFGGKELSSWLTVLPCSVAALKFNLPIRCMLSRRQDMQMTGNRRPYKAKYKVGFTKDGKIVALDLKIFSNDGLTSDWTPLMGISLLNCDGVYDIPNIRASGRCCKTNLPPSSAMRGAGMPQATIIIESIISDVAIRLNVPSHEIRELNMYKAGCLTIGNCPIERSLHRCYEQVKKQSDFDGLCERIHQFNANNLYIKQAVCLLPIKFSPCLPPFMNKGSALVNVFSDGSVLLSHGGVESGQGLHTKMIQVASCALGIPASYININESSTSVTPNATTTGGSSGSDMNGMAVLDACKQIVQRLKPLRDSNPSMSWKDIINFALKEKVNMSSFGYWNDAYNEDFDWKTGRGRAHSYYTYGAAVTHVEVDTLTGNHVILQVDVVMDVGRSLNPAIDVGQIEGGFMMGVGMCTLEEHRYSPGGVLLTIGTDKYHVPTVSNLPLRMDVTLLKDSGNDKAVYSSKGIGEPPLLLSASVWLALKDVVAYLRRIQEVSRGQTSKSRSDVFVFNVPATPNNVLLARDRQTS